MNQEIKQKITVYQWEGFLFNLICALYFLFLAPFIQEIAISNIKSEASYVPWYGVLLILISLLEIYAFPKKMRYVKAAVKEHQETVGNGFILWMFHAVISLILLFSALQAFGFNLFAKDVDLPMWTMPLIFATVIKELYFLMMIMVDGDETTKTAAKYSRPNNKEWLLDLILISYACIAYTAGWQTISYGVDMERDNTVMYILNCIVSGLLFLMFYLPLRIPYYLEEIAQLKTNWDWIKFLGSLALILIIVVLNL